MKSQMQHLAQDDQQQWQELAALDPAYRAWHDQRNAEDHAEFEAWLDSPEGRALLEIEDERASRSWWNHDGFSPVEGVCGHA